jgi:mannosyltransferase
MDKKRFYIIILVLIFSLGLCLRLYQLGRYSLWFDEAASLLGGEYIGTMAKTAGIFGAAEDRYPAFLSKLFLYYWQFPGKDEFNLRMPAIVFGALAILAIYQLGKSLSGNKTGLLAALILAISPFHIYYSREVRMYSLVGLTVLASVYFLINALKYNRFRFWFGYLVFNLISLYTHYMAVLILLAEVIFFLVYYIRSRSLFKNWLLVHGFLFLFLVPWLINVISLVRLAFTNGKAYFWVPTWIEHVSFKNVFYTLGNISAGFNASKIIYIALTVVFFLLLIFGLFKKQKTETAILFWFCFLIPIVSMYLISKVKPIYTDRYILPSAIFFYLLVANGLSGLRNKYAIPILCTIVILNGFGIRNYYRDVFPDYNVCSGAVPKKDYKSASRYIMDNFQDGDVIMHICRSSTLPFEYYFGIIDKNRAGKLIANSIFLQWKNDSRKIIPFKFKEQGVKLINSDISVENNKRVWLVFSSFIFDKIIKFKPEELPDEVRMLNYIEKSYVKEETKEFKDIIIYLFEKDNDQKS